MKENYKPWGIDITAFPEEGGIEEQLKFLIGFAILAPSGHNSQPWEFKIQDSKIFIFSNNARSLSQSDPVGRQLSIGIGCALENLKINPSLLVPTVTR